MAQSAMNFQGPELGRQVFRAAMLVATLFALGASTPGTAQTTSPAAAASLLNAEDALFAADVRHDVAAIQRGFADEAIFVHANGMVQTKADYLKAAAEAKFPIRSITTTDRTVRIFGDVGIVRGIKNLVVGDGLHLSGSYLTVYVIRDGRWQMLDEQSSPAPKPPGGQ